jgi:hypothetical protein
VPFFIFATHKQRMYSESILHISIAMFSQKKFKALAGFELGFSVPEAEAMPATAPRRQGTKMGN